MPIRRLFAFLALGLGHAAPAIAQATTGESSPVAAIDRLFASMHRADTAAIRSAFLANGRVVPMPADTTTDRSSPLSVDDFVRFMGNTASNPWDERMKNSAVKIDGSLAQVWLDYEVRRGTTFSHCGVNSVQLQHTSAGWKVVSMAFTSRQTGCGG